MNLDAYLHDQLRGLGETLLRLVEDKPAFARRQSEYWAQVARLEQRQAERLDWRPKPKTPSGTFQGVHDALAPLDEHRHTPLVPDPRKT